MARELDADLFDDGFCGRGELDELVNWLSRGARAEGDDAGALAIVGVFSQYAELGLGHGHIGHLEQIVLVGVVDGPAGATGPCEDGEEDRSESPRSLVCWEVCQVVVRGRRSQ